MTELTYEPAALMFGIIAGHVAGTLIRVPIVAKAAALLTAAGLAWGLFLLPGGPPAFAALIAGQLSLHASTGALYGAILGHGGGALLSKIAADAGKDGKGRRK